MCFYRPPGHGTRTHRLWLLSLLLLRVLRVLRVLPRPWRLRQIVLPALAEIRQAGICNTWAAARAGGGNVQGCIAELD